MSQIASIANPWRLLLLSQPASFRGVVFHVETGNRTSGRRIVPHEYPKRDQNYSEDMGLTAPRVSFTGYLVYRPNTPGNMADYVTQRMLLKNALEAPDAGRLIHPVFCPGGMQAMCERYSMSESRERGGYTTFEMQFVNAGTAPNALGVAVNTLATTTQAANTVTDITVRPPPGGFPK
jgi:prophage DNA circulation protein